MSAIVTPRENARSAGGYSPRVARDGVGPRMRNLMNTSSPSLTPAQTTARTAALTAAAAIYVEAKIRIETERALAAARLAAS